MTDQNLPSDEAVRALHAMRSFLSIEDIIHAYLTQTDEGRALVADAARARADDVKEAELRARIVRAMGERSDDPRVAKIQALTDAAIARQEGEGK